MAKGLDSARWRAFLSSTVKIAKNITSCWKRDWNHLLVKSICYEKEGNITLLKRTCIYNYIQYIQYIIYIYISPWKYQCCKFLYYVSLSEGIQHDKKAPKCPIWLSDLRLNHGISTNHKEKPMCFIKLFHITLGIQSPCSSAENMTVDA